jgi:NAD(P)-dependent dehydrogenase (short-subunit alcohol dehydrogenase family)
MTYDFTDQVVLVTGASRGIGRACALMFAQHGAKVAIHYNSNRTAAQNTLDAMPGDGHVLIPADMGDPAAVKFMVDFTVKKLGRLDVLVNNAGIFEEHPVDQLSYDEFQDRWRRTIEVNLTGPANASYCAAQVMIAQGGGRIVNVSSRGAFRGEPTAPAYGASKAGLNALGQSLAKALAPHNIYVTTVAPGWVETDMADGHLDESVRAQSPLNRVARPEEIARAVLFLASPGCEFATGAILDVNGASYLRT